MNKLSIALNNLAKCKNNFYLLSKEDQARLLMEKKFLSNVGGYISKNQRKVKNLIRKKVF